MTSPPELRKRWHNRWRGQQQKWFVMRFLGTDADIESAPEHPGVFRLEVGPGRALAGAYRLVQTQALR